MQRSSSRAPMTQVTLNSYGQVQLSIRAVNEETISIHVVKAVGLRSSLPLANAFITVGLLPVPTGAPIRNPQTNTVVCSNNPSFNESLNLDISRRGRKSRLFVAVWNKLPDKKPAELIGAMSFSLRHCLTEPFTGWYHLLEESLAMNKHLKTDSPDVPQPLRPRRIASEEMLYQNTTELHYKQPRKLHTAVVSGEALVSRRSSMRKPAPRSRPPPIPDFTQAIEPVDLQEVSADIENEPRYKVPSKSLYKRPVHPEGRDQLVKVTSREDVRHKKESGRLSRASRESKRRSSRSHTSCSSSCTSSLERLSSDQGSSHTLDRLSSNRESTHYMDATIISRPPVARHSSIRKIKRQALFQPSLMMSPDSSQSSSDSQAAWSRLNTNGTQFVPYLLQIPRGEEGFGFTISDDVPVAVCHIDDDSTAERAGLRIGDRIVEVHGEDLSIASTKQVAAIIRHQNRSMKMLIWRPTVAEETQRQTPADRRCVLTPTKRSGSKVTGNTVARKKHRQHSMKERKSSRSKRDRVADGSSMHEQVSDKRCDKALDVVTYLYDEEAEFCEVMKKSYRYHAHELQTSGKVAETETFVLFQNMDMLISMSQYFAGKLELVVRQATDGKRMIATAPEIYSPRVELVKQNYMKYIDGIQEAEQLKAVLNTGRDNYSHPKGILSLDEFIHNPLHHVQKVAAAFNVLLQNIENRSVNLPLVQKICSEMQACIEHIDSSTNINRSRSSPPDQSQSFQFDPEMVRIQQRLEFPPNVTPFDLCQGTRHKLYRSDVIITGTNHKLEAFLFNDSVLIVRSNGGRDCKLLVERDLIRIADIIDVEYGSSTNDCELTLHYTSNQRLSHLSIICDNIETKLVWKGLLRDRIVQQRPADLNCSDQGIQVSESSECAEPDELCCDAQELSSPCKGSSDASRLSDSMIAMADDLCSSNQLRNNSGDTTDCLHLADYTKPAAKPAMTVPVNNNNSVSPSATDKQLWQPETEDRVVDGAEWRTPPIDLSAITEEGDDVTSTSMHLSCSHDVTPSECVSTPIDKSQSSHSALSPGFAAMLRSPAARQMTDSDLDSAGAVNLLQPNTTSKHHRSYSNPELISEGLTSHSTSLQGCGEAMCSPTSSQKPTDISTSLNLSDVKNLTKQKSFSDENLGGFSFDSKRCSSPCQPAKASFTVGESPPSSSPTSPSTPSVDCTSSSRMSFVLPHVESESKLSSHSPAQRKALSNKIRRSKSYSTSGVATPLHAKFLQQEMTRLSVDQNAGKGDGRTRKFSAVAKNVRNVLQFFKRRTSEANAPAPPLDVVVSWSQNFSTLLNDKYGLMLFRSFLLSEYSEENIEFWIACEEYKKLKARQYPQKAQAIYSDFITVHAPKEVNLDSKTRMETMKALANPTKVTFDLAQSRIQCLMEKDSYTRFLKSPAYTSVLTQARSSAATSE